MAEVIDAHQHFWQLSRPFQYGWLQSPELEPICRDFLPEDLAPLLHEAGVDRSIFVQTQSDVEENRWVLGLAEQHDFLAGVVGWVDLASDACQPQIEEFAAHPKFVGVRHVTHDEPDDDWIVREDVIRGLKVLEKAGVPFDLLFFVKHLKHASTLAARLPDLPLVIDHLAKPRIGESGWDDWIGNFRAAATHENVYCKLSGMVTEADWKNWKPSDLRPYVEEALECFGPERCMFGSDWPVCLTAASYRQVVEALDECLGGISGQERDLIFGGTARKFYRLT